MLCECIDSILAQTRPVDEIIVVNDGSTDDTNEVVQSYGDRLTLINKPNGGKSSALNLGLKHCKSDYVWICDDDDLAAPDGAKHLAGALDLNDDADFAFGTYQFFRKDKTGYSYSEAVNLGLEHEPNICIRTLEGGFLYQYAILVRRSVYKRVGLFDEELIRAQDLDMLIRLCRSCKAVYVPEPIFCFRDHDGPRGSASEKILPRERVRKQLIYNQKVLAWVRQEFQLYEFTPTFALRWDQALAERAAFLWRACVFAAHAKWDDAIDDFRQAGRLSGVPAKPEELKLAERVLTEVDAWKALYENPEWRLKFRNCYKENIYCRRILIAACRPVGRRVRQMFRTRKFYEGIITITALCGSFGICGAFSATIGAKIRRLSWIRQTNTGFADCSDLSKAGEPVFWKPSQGRPLAREYQEGGRPL
jgi:glycosyltransferase involved in cell wall biosynthesis